MLLKKHGKESIRENVLEQDLLLRLRIGLMKDF